MSSKTLLLAVAASVGIQVFPSTLSAATVAISLQQLDRTSTSGGQGTNDLTSGGTALDWIKPIGADLSFAEKDVTNLLTLATQGATFTPGTYTDDGYTSSWSGGDSPNFSGTEFRGSNNTGAALNVGFRVTFTAPSAGAYTLRWFSAANNTQNWRLTGTIGAATQSLNAGANVGFTTGAGGVDELFWTAEFTADNAGQVLTLDLLNSTGTNSAIAITGVTVVPEPSAAALLGFASLGMVFFRRRQRN